MYNRFAEKRRRYLREYRDGIYTGMLLTGKLDEHLKEIGDTAQEMFDQLVEQMKKAEGVTERLKTENQMEWVGRMNSIRSRAELCGRSPVGAGGGNNLRKIQKPNPSGNSQYAADQHKQNLAPCLPHGKTSNYYKIVL